MLKRVDRYIAGYVLSVFVNVVGILVGLLLLHRFYRIIDLAVSRALTLFQTSQLVLWAFPMAFLYALPMSALAATLLAFGKLSADEETTACFAAGISRARLAAIPLCFSFLLAALASVNNTLLVPESYRFFDRVGFGVGVDPFKSLTPGQMARIEGRFFTVGAVDPDAQTLRDFFAVVPASDVGLKDHSKLALISASGTWLFTDEFLIIGLEKGSAMELTPPAGSPPLKSRRFEFGEMDLKVPLTYYRSMESKRLTVGELWKRREESDITELGRRVGGALATPILVFCALPFVLRSRGSVRRTSARGAIIYAVGIYFLFWLATFLSESVFENYDLNPMALAAPYLFFAGAALVLWRVRP